jgi:hypothetical protein
VPAYNVQDYIAECLESVLAEESLAVEIIVIDDGSTDSTRATAEAIARHDRRVWVFHQRNRGLGAARNTGMRRAAGDYVAFLDADDVSLPGAHRALLTAADRRGADMAIGGIVQMTGGKRKIPEWVRFLHDHDRVIGSLADFPDLLRDFYTPNKMVRRAWWNARKLRFREGVMFEDQPVITEALAASSGIAVLRMMTYQWRRRDDGSSLTGSMYRTSAIVERAHATELTRPVVEAQPGTTLRDAWTYTLVENHFLSYLRHLDQMDAPARDALIRFVRAAGAEDLLIRPPEVSPAAGALATLAHRGNLDAAARLVHAGWTEAGHIAIRGAPGRQALVAALDDPDLAASLEACFHGRGVDPRRFIVRVTAAAWTDDAALHLTVHVPFAEIYDLDGARLDAEIVDWAGMGLVSAEVTGGLGAMWHVDFPGDALAALAHTQPPPGVTPAWPVRFGIVHGEDRYETHTAVRPSPLPSRPRRTWREPEGPGLLLRWRDRYWLRLDHLPAKGDERGADEAPEGDEELED